MPEGNMAYEEVVELVSELRNLLPVLLEIVNINKFLAKNFIELVGEVLRILEMEGTPDKPDRLIETILPPLLPIRNFSKAPVFSIFLRLPNYRNYAEVETELPARVLEEFGLMENKLEKYLDETDLYDVWDDLRNNLTLLNSCVAVRDLLQASQELKETLNFFHDLATESAALCQYLEFLITLLETLQCEPSHELVEGIRVVVKKALDAVRCSKEHRISLQMRMFELKGDVLLRPLKDVLCFNAVGGNYPLKLARNFFGGKNGMRFVLLDTLGKLHSFKGEIDMIAKAFGKDCLQPWDPSFGSLQLFSDSSHLPKERKRRRND